MYFFLFLYQGPPGLKGQKGEPRFISGDGITVGSQPSVLQGHGIVPCLESAFHCVAGYFEEQIINSIFKSVSSFLF